MIIMVLLFFGQSALAGSKASVPSSVDSGVIVVSPVAAEVRVKAGDTATAELIVSNLTRQAWKVRVQLLDERGTFKGDGVEVVERDDLERDELVGVASSWSNVFVRGERFSGGDQFVLDSGQRQRVDVKVSPPKQAASGGKAMRIVFTAEPLQGDGGVGFQTSIASHVLVTTKGRVIRRLEASFVPDYPLSFNGKAKGRLVLRNLGQSIEKVDAKVRLNGVSFLGVSGESRRVQGFLLPAAQRVVLVEVRADRKFGISRGVPKIKSGKPGYPSDVQINGDILFFVPKWLIGLLVVAAVSLVVFVVARYLSRRYQPDRDYEGDWHDEDSDS